MRRLTLTLVGLVLYCCLYQGLAADNNKVTQSSSAAILASIWESIDAAGLYKDLESPPSSDVSEEKRCSYPFVICDSTRSIVGIKIDGVRKGKIHWGRLPAEIVYISLENSTFDQDLDLNSIPKNLRFFSAESVRWRTTALAATSPISSCSHDNSGCAFELIELRCSDCGLTSMSLIPLHDSLLAKTQMIDLSLNSQLAFEPTELPPTLMALNIANVPMERWSFDLFLERLPASTVYLNVSATKQRVTLNMLQRIPAQLKSLDISCTAGNAEEFNRDLSSLPQYLCPENAKFHLENLYVRNCNHTGPLPNFKNCSSLYLLDFSGNKIDGMDASELPRGLGLLYLHHNQIHSELSTSALPRELRHLNLAHNQFIGPFVIEKLPHRIHHIDISYNRFSGTVNLPRIARSTEYVYIQHNNFTGEPDLIDLPLCIRYIMTYGNNWDYRLPVW